MKMKIISAGTPGWTFASVFYWLEVVLSTESHLMVPRVHLRAIIYANGLKFPTHALNSFSEKDWSTTACRGNLLRSLKNAKIVSRDHISKRFVQKRDICRLAFGCHSNIEGATKKSIPKMKLRRRKTSAPQHAQKQDSRDDRKARKLL